LRVRRPPKGLGYRDQDEASIILIAVLGADLVVLIAFFAFVLARKRWVKRQAGAFRGVIRVGDAQIDCLGTKWGRGYGRWAAT
jgi:hypothetical protein